MARETVKAFMRRQIEAAEAQGGANMPIFVERMAEAERLAASIRKAHTFRGFGEYHGNGFRYWPAGYRRGSQEWEIEVDGAPFPIHKSAGRSYADGMTAGVRAYISYFVAQERDRQRGINADGWPMEAVE